MKMRIVSDLHLEHEYIELPVTKTESEETLILAGDICSNFDTLNKFFLDCSIRFKNVLFIYGNHEYYGHSVDDTKGAISKMIFNYANIYLLDNETLELDGIVFYGGTLWGDGYHEPTSALNDFNVVDFPELFYYNEYVDFVRKFDNVAEKIDIVISHHSPSYKSLDPQFEGSFLNKYFMNDLDHIFEWGTNLKCWIHGHTHSSNAYKIGDCAVICNPKGYFDENKKYNPKFVVDFEK